MATDERAFDPDEFEDVDEALEAARTLLENAEYDERWVEWAEGAEERNEARRELGRIMAAEREADPDAGD